MKLLFAILIIIFSLYSCEEGTENPKASKDFEKEYYFDFDEITHYKANFNAFDYILLEKDDSTISSHDIFLSEVISEFRPDSITDKEFIERLDTMNFIKTNISREKLNDLNEIFCTKNHKEIYGTMCIPKFRDILIFKKDTSIIGIAKICFECEQSSIKGSKVSTHGFGMSGDFEKLEHLLKD